MLTDATPTHATNLRMHHGSLAMRKGTVVGNAASGRTYRIDSLDELGVGSRSVTRL